MAWHLLHHSQELKKKYMEGFSVSRFSGSSIIYKFDFYTESLLVEP